MQIVTSRLLLRRPREQDLDALFDIMSNPVAMRYWSTLPHANRQATRAWLEQVIARTTAGGEDFLIEHEGIVVGYVGAGRPPDFGFILRPDAWGRGFATEAAAAFVDFAFRTRRVERLVADVDPRNAASLHVLGKLGFVEIGRAENTFLLGGEWCHSIYLELRLPP